MNKIFNILVNTGLIIIAIAVALPFFQGPDSMLYRYVFTVGAGLLVVGRIFTPYQGNVLRVKRLYRIQTWSAVFFCFAAFFMFYNLASRDWLAFTLAGAVLQAYASIAIPAAERKAAEKSAAK